MILSPTTHLCRCYPTGGVVMRARRSREDPPARWPGGAHPGDGGPDGSYPVPVPGADSRRGAPYREGVYGMKLVIIAGPPSAGKTAVTRQIIRHFLGTKKCAFLKIDVVRAFEDEELRDEFHIPARKIYSGDLCPDHTGVMVLKDAISWADGLGTDIFIVESAGLCLRCSPYVTQSLGIVVLSAVSGMNSPLKMGPMISLADVAVITKTDLVSSRKKRCSARKPKRLPRTSISSRQTRYREPVSDTLCGLSISRQRFLILPNHTQGHTPARGMYHLRRQTGDRLAEPFRRGQET